MKKLLVLMILGMFCISFAFAANGNDISQKTQVQTENAGEDDMIPTQITSQERTMTQIRIKEIVKEQNKLRVMTQNQECPETCTCTGSVMKCELENGGREMTVTAGKSGNTIVQVKDVNMSTNVTLYKSEGKIYGVFKDNETKEIKVLPDEVKEKIKQRTKAKLEEQIIELDKEGIYQVQSKKQARLFGLIPVRERVRVELNSETGEIIRIRNSWWGFLARDVKEEIIGGCGTVTPGMEDECCQNLGYDAWNSEILECE